MNLCELSIKEAAKLLKEKKISSVELTQAVLDKISTLDDKINAFITVTENLALKQATESDKRHAKGQTLGKLDGIPVAIKDNICTEGIKTTAASKILENFISPYDATVISRLKKAGAVICGKTNMDEFAMGSSTENSAFGATRNPHDLTRVPGGSSGGSAAAVVACMSIYALGSDTGGSIRQPASFCGIVGVKPTYGAVSRYGLLAMASSLDQIGPLTKTVTDSALVLEEISGHDSFDSTSVDKDIKATSGIRNYIKGFKIGIPKEYFGKGLDLKVEETVKRAIKKLEDLGAKMVEVSLPHTQYGLAVYYVIMPSEVSANLARYDGIKYGYSIAQSPEPRAQSLLDVYLKSRAEGFGDEAKRRIMLGTYALSSGYYDQYYLKAAKVRTKIKEDFENVFKEVDVLVTPTSPTCAFKIGEKVKDPLTMYLSDIYTVSANIAGIPAISIPCGYVETNNKQQTINNKIQSSKLPVGLQIMGPQFGEAKIIQVAYTYEQNN